jgi:phospholipase/lecithinase/hemolysin
VAYAKFWLFSFVVIAGLLAPGLASADGRPIDRIVVFGTSLSDPGNAFALSGQNLEPAEYATLHPLLLIPDSETPYAVGGNRHSNGPTWIEQLAKPIGLSASVKPAWTTPRIPGAFNYAVAGPRARNGVPNEVSLLQQVTRFLTDNNGAASPRSLYVIEAGSNDVADVLLSGATPADLENAALAVGQAIGALYCSGAAHFVVWNVPNLGRTPAVLALNPFTPVPPIFEDLVDLATTTTTGFNNGLKLVLDSLRASPPPCAQHGLNIIEFDAFGRLENVVEHKRRYGLQNVTEACIQPQGPAPQFRCSNQDRYLFWDGIHPTRAGHAIIAVEVVKTILKEALQH